MPAKLLGCKGSNCTRKVVLTALELGIDLPLQEVDFAKGENRTAEYKQKYQPFGKIPVYVDGDFVLFESRAIARYLNDLAGSKLLPKDPKARAIVEQWLAIEAGVILPAVDIILMERLFAKYHGREGDAALAEAQYNKLQPALDVLETQLSKHPFVGGDEFSLVDIFLIDHFYKLEQTPEKGIIHTRPNIEAWFRRVSSRGTYQKVLASY